MFSKFTEECQKVLLNAKKEMQKLKHPYVGSEHLLLSMLSYSNNVSKKLNSVGVDYNRFRNKIIDMIGYGTEENGWFLYTPLLKRVLESSILDSKDNNNAIITLEHLFISLLEEGEGIAIRVLISMHVNIDALYNEFFNKCQNKKNDRNKKLKIYDYGSNLVAQAKKGCIDPVIGRDEEVSRMIEILCRRRKNNPLLLGEAGVGKSALVEELARRIAIDQVPDYLKNKKIVSVAMSSLVSGTKYRGEFEERINKMIKELENNRDIILFIDEIHTLVGAGGAEGAIDASNILKPALARGNIQVIGATTTTEYKKFIEFDRALSRRFQTLTLEEPSPEKTMQILEKLAPIYENYHHVKISRDLLESIVRLSNKYIKDRLQPDKAIDILDEACVKVSLKENQYDKKMQELKENIKDTIKNKTQFIKKNNFVDATAFYIKQKQLEERLNKLEVQKEKHKKINVVSKKDIIAIVESKGKVKIYDQVNNHMLLQKLSKNLRRSIKGQTEAIDKIIKGTKKILYNYRQSEKPLSFLFVGPTGVGKTYLAKQYSDLLFGKKRMIKLDMSEYKDEASINKLIGSPAGYVGYNDKNSIFEEIINHPHSLLLLDEIEKAHPAVLNLFLQILEEGKIKDATGKNIYFDNTIIIMTSNAGCHKEKMGFLDDKEELIDNLKAHFNLEFLNRVDEIVLFNRLNEETMKEIVGQKIKQLVKDYQKHQVKIKISHSCIHTIIKKSEFEKFGARKIDKLIEDLVDEKIMDRLCEGNVIIQV